MGRVECLLGYVMMGVMWDEITTGQLLAVAMNMLLSKHFIFMF